MSQNLMQKLLAERQQAVNDKKEITERVSDQMPILHVICEELQKLHGKLDKLLQRPSGTHFVQNNNEQNINPIPTKPEPQPEAFIPSIDTGDMAIKGTVISAKKRTRKIDSNIAGLKDINGE